MMFPIFRSANQAAILGCLFTEHDREWSGPELVDAADVSQQTVSRELRSLEDAGLIVRRRVGNTVLARADDSAAVFPELVALMHKTYGPLPLLDEALSAVRGVDEAHVFGSWAARFLGQPGSFPRDVDVLVVGDDVDADAVWDACARVERIVGMPVNPTILSRSEWDDPDPSGFVAEIRDAARVPVGRSAARGGDRDAA